MSTLEVTCGRCDRRFRVRAEFAGKTTRCPGCSAPITISGSKPAAPPRQEPAERSRPRPRRTEDEGDRPRTPTGDWRPVATALGREQVAVLFVLATILGSYLVMCIGSAAGRASGGVEQSIALTLMLLVLVGPALAASVFGLMARVSAVRAPRESLARGSAVPSLVCGFAALASLVMFGITMLSGMDRSGPSGLARVVAVGGLILSALASLGTFLGFVAQVGIARRSAEVSRAVGRTAGALCIVVVILLGLAFFYTLVSELSTPAYVPQRPGGPIVERPRNDEGPFFAVFGGFLLPVGAAVVLILYHRLLAAARRAVLDEATERVDD